MKKPADVEGSLLLSYRQRRLQMVGALLCVYAQCLGAKCAIDLDNAQESFFQTRRFSNICLASRMYSSNPSRLVPIDWAALRGLERLM